MPISSNTEPGRYSLFKKKNKTEQKSIGKPVIISKRRMEEILKKIKKT
jgi:hypothetical protein